MDNVNFKHPENHGQSIHCFVFGEIAARAHGSTSAKGEIMVTQPFSNHSGLLIIFWRACPRASTAVRRQTLTGGGGVRCGVANRSAEWVVGVA